MAVYVLIQITTKTIEGVVHIISTVISVTTNVVFARSWVGTRDDRKYETHVLEE